MSVTRVAVAALLVAGAACSSDDSTTASVEPADLVDAVFGLRGTPSQTGQLEQHVVDCMSSRGFEYVRGTADLDASGAAEPPTFWLDPDVERAAEQGFGIVDAFVASQRSEVEIEADDPLAALDDADRDAYEEALFGSAVEQERNGGAPGGCLAEGEHTARMAALADGANRYVLGYTELLAGSAVLPRIEADWSGCMRRRGYDFVTEDDAHRYVRDAMGAAAVPQDGAPINGPELDELARLERTVAVADVECIAPLQSDLHDELQRLATEALGG